MAVYFDHTDPADVALLPVPLRTSKDLEDVAPLCEQDVILHFARRQPDLRFSVVDALAGAAAGRAPATFVWTSRGKATDLGNGVLVYLAGYTVDSEDVTCDANLRMALKREIAEVVRWRLYQAQREVAVTGSGGQGGVTKSYRPEADDPFPPWFGRWLKAFDTRPAVWAL